MDQLGTFYRTVFLIAERIARHAYRAEQDTNILRGREMCTSTTSLLVNASKKD